MVDIQHMICRYPNITAPAFPLPVSILKVCANIDVPHRCLSNGESESGDDVPISCQWVRHLDWRPTNHTSSITCSITRWVWRDVPSLSVMLTYQVAVSFAMKECIVECGAKMAVGFHVLSTGVCLCWHCSHPHPVKTKLKPCWLTASLTGRVRKGDSCVFGYGCFNRPCQ